MKTTTKQAMAQTEEIDDQALEQFGQLCDSIAAALARAGVTEEELQAGLAETREELARERYPGLLNRK